MKKTLSATLGAALLVGMTSTTFAATNPFSDVPADHWAYDAVTQLANDGVIEGYGDTTFKGNRNITRYEMAQMVAKAMAKNTSGADKALVDKLAAEFAEELNNLGVRVANLERNADKVKWNGEARYTYTSDRYDLIKSGNELLARLPGLPIPNNVLGKSKKNNDKVLFRLQPTAEVNSHWKVKARLDATNNMQSDESGNVSLKRIWAEGNYGKFTAKLGKLPMSVDSDLLFDDEYSGAQLEYGKDVKVTVGAGRWDLKRLGAVSFADSVIGDSDTIQRALRADSVSKIPQVEDKSKADYQVIGVQYDKGGKFSGGVAFHHLKNEIFNFTSMSNIRKLMAGEKIKDKDAYIWSVNAAYKFDKNSKLKLNYAQNTKADSSLGTANFVPVDLAKLNGADKAYSIEYDYKGAVPANRGSWGAYVAYRHLGAFVAADPSYDGIKWAERGWELGANYTVAKNVVTTVKYAQGKQLFDNQIGLDNGVKRIFGRVQFFF
ncbi:S-layer homology domain-containing protein [Selenomonas ruminantium]|uniref:S-layer homology domain-containing protein n=1 Tax=Selenomonas ruminantium TaxID=971 RepID=A0A1H0RVM8_SELRU|nr:S-layer homology domain-containing protein [Selenomonas ruminantium]SDP33641.1 S-layer homology domain-containing protein [Selenomonas ruminantium]